MKAIRIALGLLLSIIGLLGMFFGLLSIADPIDAQLADDHNPLAKPPAVLESIWISAVYASVSAAGVLLLFWPSFKKRITSGGDEFRGGVASDNAGELR